MPQKKPHRKLLWLAGSVIVLVLLGMFFSMRSSPQNVTYGVSFSKLHSDELGLDWRKTYLAILDDLQVRKLRLSAHWPMVEPEENNFNFDELDFQMQEAATRGAKVILAVGKKTPGWPECHTPDWAAQLEADREHMVRLAYIQKVVERYKDSPALELWQVENEAFLNFATARCGKPDETFFAHEVALVRSLDPAHRILATDGGEFGTWYKAHRYADVFGSTMYLYVWTGHIGYWRYPISPAFFRFKQNMLDVVFGKKPMISVEVGLEPWLNKSISSTPIEEQLEHMSMERFNEILSFARESGFEQHYLWGVEWWYYLKTVQNHPEFWDAAKKLFSGTEI